MRPQRYWILLNWFVDLLGLSVALAIAYLIRDSAWLNHALGQIQAPSAYLVTLPLAALFLLAIFGVNGLYRGKLSGWLPESVLVMKSLTVWAIVAMATAFLFRYEFSRLLLPLWSLGALILVTGGRSLVRRLRFRLLQREIGVTYALIIGSPELITEIKDRPARFHQFGVIPSHYLVSDYDHIKQKLRNLDEIHRIIKTGDIKQVYISDPRLPDEVILDIVALCPHNGIEFRIAADIFRLATGQFDVQEIDTIPALDLRRSRPPRWFRLAKRTSDLLIALPALILTAPLWLIITLLIKRDSPGPALIKQTRIGYRGQPFTLYKFRTMHADTPLYEAAPRQNGDRRVTPIGAWLRRTSLDELPQLLNVLRGEMSVVGPRPEMPFIVANYRPWQRKRLEAKPGLTGLWQILGRKDLPMENNLEYDFYYLNNQSLFLDAVILLKTIPTVLFGRGAY